MEEKKCRPERSIEKKTRVKGKVSFSERAVAWTASALRRAAQTT